MFSISRNNLKALSIPILFTWVAYLAYREKTPLFYMEATISIGDKAMEGSYAWLDGLCNALDNLVSPNFRLDVDVIKVPLKPSKTPSVKTFCEYVQTQLAERHPDEILAQMQAKGLPFIPLQKFQSNGWEIMIDMWAVSPARRQSASEGTLSSISYPAEWTYDTEIAPLFKKLDDEKRPSRYGDFDLPYIIAIDAVNTVNPTSIINTLIEQRSFEKHPKITAVLIANELVPRAIPRKTPVLWHNPFATYPLDQDIWLLPQRIQDMQKSQWNYRDGKKGWEIFQLYEEWPDEKLLTSN